MIEIFTQLEQTFKNTHSFAYTLLRRGNSIEYIKETLAQHKINFFPPELIDFFLWHDGMEDSDEMIGKLQLFHLGYFLALNKAISYQSAKPAFWQKIFFPLFTNNGGDFLLYNFKNNFIYYYSPVILGKKPMKKYDNLKTMFETIINCYAEKAYYFEDDFFEIDYDKEEQISRQLNPKSQYWLVCNY